MKLLELEAAVLQHSGEFLCEQIHKASNTFKHLVGPASEEPDLPSVGRLQDFYDTFGSIVFYHDEDSGDAARHIAPPSEWVDLDERFSRWLDGLDNEELSELVPDWIDTRLVVGETPESGNCILMVREGPLAGQVFEFDHDGFEFSHRANNLIEYVEKILKPDSATLTDFASHMRFMDNATPMVQWWIKELRDNRGNVVATEI
jgi:hypothetical protein